MGIALMADDRDLIIGELREGVRTIKEHLIRQDDVQLVRDQQLEINKRAAIERAEAKDAKDEAARKEKEAKDEARFRVLDEKTTLTGGRVSLLEKMFDEEIKPVIHWHRDEGGRLGSRVSTLEQAELVRATERAQADKAKARREGESHIKKIVYGFIGTLLGAIGLTTLTVLVPDAINALKRIFGLAP